MRRRRARLEKYDRELLRRDHNQSRLRSFAENHGCPISQSSFRAGHHRKAKKMVDQCFRFLRGCDDHDLRDGFLPAAQITAKLTLYKIARRFKVFENTFPTAKGMMNVNGLVATVLTAGEGLENSLLTLSAKAVNVF